MKCWNVRTDPDLLLTPTSCMLPKDFPRYKTVYSYFRQWGAKPFADRASLLESLLQELVAAERLADGRQEKTTFLIADAQSVKNTDTAGEKGYDAGKKVSGIKRHILVDTCGRPHAIAITTADVTDRKGALLAMSCPQSCLFEVKKVLVKCWLMAATPENPLQKGWQKSFPALP